MTPLPKTLLHTLKSTKIGSRLEKDPQYKMILGTACSFAVNLLYALYHGVLGIVNGSLWFITMCAYYTILSTTRFSAILCERQNSKAASDDMEYFVMKLTGGLLAVFSFVLTGVISLSLSENIATKHETVVMITIATYTFYKITLAILRAVKHRKNPSPLLRVIRSIGYADVAASIFTLQRSMFASFGDLTGQKAFIMDVSTGAAVCLFVCILGISMIIRGNRKDNKNV